MKNLLWLIKKMFFYFILFTERKGIDKLIESSKELGNDNLSQSAQFLLKSNKWKFVLVFVSIVYLSAAAFLSVVL